jgi:hypothetical protein
MPASRKPSYLNNISLRYNEETKKLRKLIRNKFSRKQEQCEWYFFLTSREFNMLSPCHCGNMKAVCYGGGTLPDKEQPFFFHCRMHTGSSFKIELLVNSNFWRMTQWCTSSAGDEVAVFTRWHKNGKNMLSRKQDGRISNRNKRTIRQTRDSKKGAVQ